MRYYYLCLCWLFLICWHTPVQGQLTIADTLTTQELIETLFGGGVTVSNITTTCDTNIAMAQFDGTNSNLGLSTGVIISSGEAMDATGPNQAAGTSTSVGTPGDSLLESIITSTITTGFDACVIEFDIVPLCDTIGINYVFASEEYPEFAPPNSSGFNDVFAFFIEGPGITGIQNIALIPGTTTPVSINNVNAVTWAQYYVDNTGGTSVEYDGFTVPLLASATVQACETYHITLAIQDVGDPFYDSAVFLEAGGIGCVSPVLTLNAVNSTALGSNVAVEGCVNFGIFTFELDVPLPDTAVFHYTVGGTATSGIDYVPIQDSVIIPAGQLSANLPVLITADGIVEGVETIEIYYTDTSLCANNIYYDTAVMEIWDQPSIPPLQDVSLCSNDTIPIGFAPDTGQTYAWTPNLGLSDDSISDPMLTLVNTGLVADTSTYTLTTIAFQGFCIYVDSMEAVVRPEIQGSFSVDTVCFGYEHTFTPQIIGDSLSIWLWDFGDSNGSMLESPTHTYAAPGPYQASLIVENVWGCRDTSSEGVYVDSLPLVNFTVEPVCQGASSVFVNDVRSGVSYFWDFGDGNVSSQPNPSHIYGSDGTYSVLLVATTAPGCVDSIRSDAIVYANPVASFEATSECLNTPNQFTDITVPGSGSQLTYFWNFGDGTTSTLANPNHTFLNFGLNPVVLIVTDEYGCTDDTLASALVHALPVAEFLPDSFCAQNTWRVENNSFVPDNSEIVSYVWEFGNGESSQQYSPNIRFNDPGLFSVFLKVLTEHGCPDSTETNIEVYPLPISKFRAYPACLYDSAGVYSFSEVIDSLFDDQIVDWTWDWGDGFFSGSLTSTGHVYREPGSYRIELEVITDKGCSHTSGRHVEIWPLPEPPELIPDTVCFGDAAFLIAVNGQHTDRLEWRTDPDDAAPFLIGNTYETPPVLYTQTYYVQAISARNCSLPSLPIRAERYGEGNLEIILSDEVVEIPQAIVNFSIGTNVELTNYRWNLGDGTISEVATPVHEYEFPGKYEISLQATDTYGCEYQLKKVIEVKQVITVHIPTAFSPNGDGINDEFYVRSRLIRSMSFRVFNRWGELVYETDDSDFAWNGRSIAGQQLLEGVYVYHMRAVDLHGNIMNKTGTVTLVR